MSIFGRFRRKKHASPPAELNGTPPAGETAPGVRAIRDLWAIEPRPPVERVEGEVVTDIYATQRPNGMPRRRHQRRTPNESDEFTPPF